MGSIDNVNSRSFEYQELARELSVSGPTPSDVIYEIFSNLEPYDLDSIEGHGSEFHAKIARSVDEIRDYRPYGETIRELVSFLLDNYRSELGERQIKALEKLVKDTHEKALFLSVSLNAKRKDTLLSILKGISQRKLKKILKNPNVPDYFKKIYLLIGVYKELATGPVSTSELKGIVKRLCNYGSFEKAVEVAESMSADEEEITSFNNRTRSLIFIAKRADRVGRYQTAMKVAAMASNNPVILGENVISPRDSIYNYIVEAASRSGSYPEALKAAGMISNNFKRDEAYLLILKVACNSKDYEWAMRAAGMISDFCENDHKAHKYIVKAVSKSGDYEWAMQVAGMFSELYGDSDGVYELIIKTASKAGDYEWALSAVKMLSSFDKQKRAYEYILNKAKKSNDHEWAMKAQSMLTDLVEETAEDLGDTIGIKNMSWYDIYQSMIPPSKRGGLASRSPSDNTESNQKLINFGFVGAVFAGFLSIAL